MVNALSNFVNNPAEEIHKIERKHKHANKKCERRGVKYKD